MMIRVMRFVCVLALFASIAIGAGADSVTLSGTLEGTDSNTIRDDGDGNHDYDIDRDAASVFYWTAGDTVTITGTVDVSGLTSGSYLEIGLVDLEQADLSLDTYSHGGYMFNNSAFATFYAGSRNYARLSDNNDLYSGQLFNPVGNTVGVFNFTLDIMSDGNMELTLHGASGDVSTTYTYGHRNWGDGSSYWSGGELASGSYLLAQLWIDTGSTASIVSAQYNITGSMPTPVPEPATMTMVGVGLAALAAMKVRKRHSA